MIRYYMELSGHVQGGGFRDFCRRQAKNRRVNCTGWIANDAEHSSRLLLEIQGEEKGINEFLARAEKGNGTCAVTSYTQKEIPCVEGETDFRVIAQAMYSEDISR